jgi:hypothetical protein
MRVEILESFTGFPDDTDASRTEYAPGGPAIDVPDDFGAMIVAKGLAREVKPSRKDKEEKPV